MKVKTGPLPSTTRNIYSRIAAASAISPATRFNIAQAAPTPLTAFCVGAEKLPAQRNGQNQATELRGRPHPSGSSAIGGRKRAGCLKAQRKDGLKMQFQAVLANAKHTEYDVATIPSPSKTRTWVTCGVRVQRYLRPIFALAVSGGRCRRTGRVEPLPPITSRPRTPFSSVCAGFLPVWPCIFRLMRPLLRGEIKSIQKMGSYS